MGPGRYDDGVSQTIDGETGMYLIREALEGLIEPRVASSVIFEALERGGVERLPSDAEGLLSFIQGPLQQATEERVGESTAGDVVDRLTEVLERALRRPDQAAQSRTVEVPAGAGPVRVLVMGRGTSLAVRLRAALGGDRVAVGAATALPAAEHLVTNLNPELVVLDAVDPIQDSTEALVSLLRGLSPACTRLVWGREQPWAERMAETLESAGVPFTPVDRREGVDPLLDLIRSRPRSH